jgi:hypothetical protein
MRDPKRIKIITKLLKKAWKTKPHMRLGQLLYAIAKLEQVDLYYMEDGQLEKHLNEMLIG